MLQITPHVITSIEEADSITREFQEKLNVLKNSTKAKAPETDSGQTSGVSNER